MIADLQGLETRPSMSGTHISAKGIQRRDFMLGIALTGTMLPILAIAERYVPPQAIIAADVLAFMEKVAKWQLANPSRHRPTDWAVGALSAGMMALSDVATDPEYRRAMMAVGQINGWQTGPGTYNANDYCIGQMYCEMYMIYNDPAMITPLRKQFDYIIANPPRTPLRGPVPLTRDFNAGRGATHCSWARQPGSGCMLLRADGNISISLSGSGRKPIIIFTTGLSIFGFATTPILTGGSPTDRRFSGAAVTAGLWAAWCACYSSYHPLILNKAGL